MSFELLTTDEAVCTDKNPSAPDAKVVKCDSPEAAFQLVGKGSPISAADAKRFGVKTKPGELAGYTLLVDSHTIARTPEEKAYAMTQPQPGLVRARAEQIRSAASLEVASLTAADQTKAFEAGEESKKADALADKKLKVGLENKSDKGTSSTKAERMSEAKAAKQTAADEKKTAKQAAADEKKAAKKAAAKTKTTY